MPFPSTNVLSHFRTSPLRMEVLDEHSVTGLRSQDLWKLGQVNQEFKVILGYKSEPCLKITTASERMEFSCSLFQVLYHVVNAKLQVNL